MKKIIAYLLALSVSCSVFAVDMQIAPVIIAPTIIGGTSTGNAATATTLAPNPAALNSIGITGSETITALATPAAPTGTPSTTGGTVAASTTNYCTIVALDSTGTVTGTQSAAVITTGTTSSIAWVGTPVTGAVSYQFWLSTTSGVYTKYFASATASFTQTAPASSGTAGTFPTGNSTGQLKVINSSPSANSIALIGDQAGQGISFGSGSSTNIYRSSATGLTAGGDFSISARTLLGTSVLLSSKIIVASTLPTIASGFGTTPSAVTGSGTAGFTLTVGSGGTDMSGVLTFPAATTRWAVTGVDNTSFATISLKCIGTSATSVTVYAYSETTGLAVAFNAGDVLTFMAMGL